MIDINPGTLFDTSLLSDPHLNAHIVNHLAKSLSDYSSLSKNDKVLWLIRAVQLIDLTTLAGDDSFSNVQRLCWKSLHPLSPIVLKSLSQKGYKNIESITTAAVCVYPSMVKAANETFYKTQSPNVPPPIAAVAAGFPSGLYGLDSRLLEIKYAVENGAREIDIVIQRSLALQDAWEDMYNEVFAMKKACTEAARCVSKATGQDNITVHLKAILAVGELGCYTRVYKASMTCLMAGADFIKTSTGKEAVNATLSVGFVMALALRKYAEKTGIWAGFKPAGGIRSSHDALQWMVLMQRVLGEDYTKPHLFRFGASGLLTDIEKWLYQAVSGIPLADGDLLIA